MKYELNLENYCAEDDTYSATGKMLIKPDFNTIQKNATTKNYKTICMKSLGGIIIIKNNKTLHIYSNGKVVINKISSLKEAINFLEEIL